MGSGPNHCEAYGSDGGGVGGEPIFMNIAVFSLHIVVYF